MCCQSTNLNARFAAFVLTQICPIGYAASFFCYLFFLFPRFLFLFRLTCFNVHRFDAERAATDQELLQVLEDVERERSSRCATDAELDEVLSDVARHSRQGLVCDSDPDAQRPKKKKEAKKLWKKKARQATAFVAPSKEAWGEAGSSPTAEANVEAQEEGTANKKRKKQRKKKKAVDSTSNDVEDGKYPATNEDLCERVINVKFLLQSHQEYYITHYKELGFS